MIDGVGTHNTVLILPNVMSLAFANMFDSGHDLTRLEVFLSRDHATSTYRDWYFLLIAASHAASLLLIYIFGNDKTS